MARKLSIFITISLFVFGPISLSRADSGSADKRDIIIDNAIGGMREGSRIVSPDTYGKKTQIPKVPGTRLSPSMDTRVVAAAPAADTAKAGIFPGGSSSGIAAGVNEVTSSTGGSGIESPSGTDTGGIGGGGTTADSGGSLIDVDASVDLSSGSVDAGVSLDTSNTDKILEADLTAGAGEAGGITSSTDITAGDLTTDSALPAEITESAISSETDIGTEVDTSGSSVGSEAEIGVEADIEGGGEGVDVASDPADGLPVI